MTEPHDARLCLDIYGLRIAVAGNWPEVVESIGLDFAWFRRVPGSRPDVTVTVERREPALDAFGALDASFVTPRNVVYQSRTQTIVDYFGHAVSVLDRSLGSARIEGESENLVHEAAYHFILSRAGEHLDRRGLVRLHALGLVSQRGALALMLPSGGGKSTLALRALADADVELASEDSPLLDRRGRLHPFPLRIGLDEASAEGLFGTGVRRIERMEFGPKLVLEVDTFRDRIASGPKALRHIVIGHRSLGRDAKLRRLRRRSAVGPLFREAVVGVGVYQGMEFVLQRGLRDVLAKTGVAGTRARCCAAGLSRAEVWSLTLGRDHERNWAVLRQLLAAEPD